MPPRYSVGRTPSGSIAPRFSAMPCIGTWWCSTARQMRGDGRSSRLPMPSVPWKQLPTGGLPKTGRTGAMQRGEIWFAGTPGGDRPVLVLTRDPVADRIGSVVVAALTRTRRGLVSELLLTTGEDGVPTDCVVNFDNVHSLPRSTFRRRVTQLSARRMTHVCRTLRDALGC